jgi:hypothetical protein
MASEDTTGEVPIEEEETDEIAEHVIVAETTTPPPREAIVATMTPASNVKPSSFMTRWRADQWLAALLALLGPLALMGGLVFVFRKELRDAMEAVGF